MTTKITVETCTWPVAVRLDDNFSSHDGERRIWRYGGEEVFVPALSKRDFHITSTRSLTVCELPEGATGLPESCGGFGTSVPLSKDN